MEIKVSKVEEMAVSEYINKTITIYGKFDDGTRFFYTPDNGAMLFDKNITDIEWEDYLIYTELESDDAKIRKNLFESLHSLGMIEKDSERWKQIFIKLKNEYPNYSK